MRALAGAGVGVVFGVMLVWSGMTSPDVIREALLFKAGYLFLFMFSAMGTATLGQWLLRIGERRALLTGAPLQWITDRPQPRHVYGALIFGVGWGVSNVCPGPIATQLGQGIGWALFTFAGAVVGIWAFGRSSAVETEPAADPVPVSALTAHLARRQVR